MREMKTLLLFLSLFATIGCSTHPVRNVAGGDSTCSGLLRGSTQSSLTDEGIRLCFEEAVANWSAVGFSTPGSEPSSSDRAAVSGYVNSWAYLINRALRTGDSKYINANSARLGRLDQALLKFPIFRGVVFRGSEFPPNRQLTKDTTFTDAAFVSTTMDVSIAEHYAGVKGYISVILSRSGRVVQYDQSTRELSAEREVLFPRDRVFRVFDVQEYKKTEVRLVFLVEQ